MLSRATSTSGLPGFRRLERFTVGLPWAGRSALTLRAWPGKLLTHCLISSRRRRNTASFAVSEPSSGQPWSSVRAHPESEVKRDPSVRLAELAGSDQAFDEILNLILWNFL